MKKIMLLVVLSMFVSIIACSKSGSAGSSQDNKNAQIASVNVQKEETKTTDYSKLLTAEEVSKACGIKNVKSVPKNKEKRLMGELNFVKPDDKEILIINIMPVRPEEHDRYRTEYKKHKYEEVSGFGDLAFVSTQKVMNISISQFIFIKGSISVILTSSLDATTMKNYFSLDDLKKLAALMISRL